MLLSDDIIIMADSHIKGELYLPQLKPPKWQLFCQYEAILTAHFVATHTYEN